MTKLDETYRFPCGCVLILDWVRSMVAGKMLCDEHRSQQEDA